MRRLLLGLLLLSALPACESTLEPKIITGRYSLRAAPVNVHQDTTLRIDLLADTLWFQGDGTVRRSSRLHLDYRTSADTAYLREQFYRYRASGQRIELEFVCPINAMCSPPPRLWGVITTDGLELRETKDARPPLHYLRIAS